MSDTQGRFKLGDIVTVKEGAETFRPRQTGVIIHDDGTNFRPFSVRFKTKHLDSYDEWFGNNEIELDKNYIIYQIINEL